MKTLAFIVVMIPFMGMNTLAQNPDVQKLMDNKDAREEIYKTIMNDHNLIMEFLGDVQHNDHAKAMMQQHQAMYGSNAGNSQGMMMGNNQNMMGNSQEMTGNQQHMMGNNQNMMGNSQQMTGNNQHMMGMSQENIQRMNQMMGYFQENPELVPRMMGNMMDMCVSDSTLCEPMAEVMSHHPQMMRLGEQKMQENSQSATTSGK
ncbi:MAG: hypothetical protein ACWGNV_18380 [Bacteroidales bacterium]